MANQAAAFIKDFMDTVQDLRLTSELKEKTASESDSEFEDLFSTQPGKNSNKTKKKKKKKKNNNNNADKNNNNKNDDDDDDDDDNDDDDNDENKKKKKKLDTDTNTQGRHCVSQPFTDQLDMTIDDASL